MVLQYFSFTVPVPSRSLYYHGTEIPQIAQYCHTVLTNILFSKDFCAKNQFIDQVNKLGSLQIIYRRHFDATGV